MRHRHVVTAVGIKLLLTLHDGVAPAMRLLTPLVMHRCPIRMAGTLTAVLLRSSHLPYGTPYNSRKRQESILRRFTTRMTEVEELT